MLSALLLSGLLASPIATLALFLRRSRYGRAEAFRARAARLAGAVVWTLLVAAAATALLAVIGATTRNLEAAAIALVAASVVWLPVTRGWGAVAHVCWSVNVFVFAFYLVFMFWWTFASHVGPVGEAGSLVLWVLELMAALLGCAYLWELCDTMGRASWQRRVGPRQLAALPQGGHHPLVSLHVPCHNEPPDMVIATLETLTALDYPNYEVVAIDDNTDDPALWHPVREWCHEHSVKFAHLSDWPGYKSGALNYALEHLADPRAELIGVVDSDYQIDAGFLASCVPLFADPGVAFIQAPQDYRDWDSAPFYRWLYYSYKYFFSVSQPSRNERDGAIFAGTMGLIRREALVAVGGWDEWCITEDAELSLRLLRAGWSGLHVDPSFGRGIMPLTFEALKGQRFRWCFGGIQILRRNWRYLLPGTQHEGNRLDAGQRWAYLSGALQWYGDLLGVLFYGCLLVGAANLALGGGLLFRKLSGFLIAAIPLLVVLGLLRAIALLRRGTGASWRDALGAFLIWQSTSLTVARASLQALFAKQAAFLRTPKTMGEPKLSDAFKGNWAETSLGAVGLLGIAGSLTAGLGFGNLLIAGLLVWPTLSFLSAPFNSISAQRAALPPDLDARRRTEYQRYGARRITYAFGGLGLVAGITAVAMALFAAGPTDVVPPQLVGPAKGHPAAYGRTPKKPTTASDVKHGAKPSTSTTIPGATTTTTTPATTVPGTTVPATAVPTTTATTTPATTTTPTTAPPTTTATVAPSTPPTTS